MIFMYKVMQQTQHQQQGNFIMTKSSQLQVFTLISTLRKSQSYKNKWISFPLGRR